MAGRPKGSTNKKTTEEVKAETFTKEDMIALAKEMAKEMVSVEVEKIKSEQAKVKKSSIDMNMLVKIKSNVEGKLIWSHKRSSTGVNILLKDYGAEDWISLAEAKDIDRWSALLREGKIYITELNSDEYDMEDIIRFLGLSRLYDEDAISPNDIEEYLTKNDIGAVKFAELLNNSMEIGETIMEVACMMKKQGKIKELYKLDALKAKDASNNRYRL